jgi:Tfp pilus assembly protein PilV
MLKLIEALLVIGGVLGFAVYQLVSVRRQIKADHTQAAATDEDNGAAH